MFKDPFRTASLVQFLCYTNLLCMAMIVLLILYINLTNNVRIICLQFSSCDFLCPKMTNQLRQLTAPLTFVKICACFNSI